MSTPFTPFTPLAHPIGFYPVVPTADWVERLLGWGVRTIQLRIKAADHTPANIAVEVKAAIDAGKAGDALSRNARQVFARRQVGSARLRPRQVRQGLKEVFK